MDANTIPGGSMEPTLQIGDFVFVKKFSVSPERGDLITFYPPPNAITPGEAEVPNRKRFVKRLIGIPGDTIYYYYEPIPDSSQAALRISINNKILPIEASEEILNQEDYDIPLEGIKLFYEKIGDKKYKVFFGDRPFHEGAYPSDTTFRLGEDEFFFLGDNRGNSSDSRFWGTVPKENIDGKVVFKYLSFNWKDYTCSKPVETDSNPYQECPKDIMSRWSRMKFRFQNIGPIE